MPAASYSRRRSPHATIASRRGVRLARGLSANAAVGGGGGAPTVPADAIVGQPTWRMIGWGSTTPVTYTAATRATWHGRGFGGDTINNGYLRHFGGSDDYKGSTSAGDADGGVYNLQRAIEGVHGTYNQPYVANLHSAGDVALLSFYMQDAGSGNVPVLGDWWNATLESNFAADLGNVGAFAGFIGMDGLGLDFEPYNGKSWAASGYSGDTHIAAQNRAKVYEWFYNGFSAYLVGHPHPLIFAYSIYPPKGYNAQIQLEQNAYANAWEDRMYHDALHGICGAMAAANSNGRVLIADATYYRPAPEQSNKLNTQGPLAYLSNYFTQANWNWAARHLDIAQFTWAGTDNTGYYNGTQPAEPAYSNMLAQARTWGMGANRIDYEFDGGVESNAAFGLYAGSNNWTFPAGRVTGMQAAASQTAISTIAPPLTITNAIFSAGFVTITGTAGPNAYGTRDIEIYDSNFVLLGSARMTWNKAGGDYTTNYDSSYMTWTFTIAGAIGNWYVCTHVSTKDDRHSARVQAT